MKKVFITKPSIYKNFSLTGIRPYRSIGSNISLQYFDNKKIFNCYGHGGKGWSILYGSVCEILDLIYKNNISRHENITVLGAGCMGLTIAAYLKINNYKVNLVAQDYYNIASYKAGANFTIGLTRARDFTRAQLNYNFLRSIYEGNHQIIKPEAISKIKSYAHSSVIESHLKLIDDFSEDVIIDSGAKFHLDYKSYYNYFIDVNIFLKNLKDYLLANNVVLYQQKINSFNEIDSGVIINCTGIGSRELLEDRSLRPSVTHMIAFQDSPLDYILKTSKDDHFYIYPKTSYTNNLGENLQISGIIGGLKNYNLEISYELFYELINQKLDNFFGH